MTSVRFVEGPARNVGHKFTSEIPEKCNWIQKLSTQDCESLYHVRVTLSPAFVCSQQPLAAFASDINVQLSTHLLLIERPGDKSSCQIVLPKEIVPDKARIKWHRRAHELRLDLPLATSQSESSDESAPEKGEIQEAESFASEFGSSLDFGDFGLLKQGPAFADALGPSMPRFHEEETVLESEVSRHEAVTCLRDMALPHTELMRCDQAGVIPSGFEAEPEAESDPAPASLHGQLNDMRHPSETIQPADTLENGSGFEFYEDSSQCHLCSPLSQGIDGEFSEGGHGYKVVLRNSFLNFRPSDAHIPSPRARSADTLPTERESEMSLGRYRSSFRFYKCETPSRPSLRALQQLLTSVCDPVDTSATYELYPPTPPTWEDVPSTPTSDAFEPLRSVYTASQNAGVTYTAPSTEGGLGLHYQALASVPSQPTNDTWQFSGEGCLHGSESWQIGGQAWRLGTETGELASDTSQFLDPSCQFATDIGDIAATKSWRLAGESLGRASWQLSETSATKSLQLGRDDSASEFAAEAMRASQPATSSAQRRKQRRRARNLAASSDATGGTRAPGRITVSKQAPTAQASRLSESVSWRPTLRHHQDVV